MSQLLDECTCATSETACEACLAAAVHVAEAAATTFDRGGARAVNEIDHEDPVRGRVITVRRDSDGPWRVVSVRPMGSAERARCRPAPARA